ncbi:MAG: outer membrane lipoprotein LolB [Hydrogenophilales bacterium 16-64-46]|nr:MAG: outer membrane lipoprotein LolB [Hydrogenophilales bacterium 12-64-13]OYZ07289.1 MAG: outer membrane lipoprotein LolB [Hydrogenophilales bacterium 16-64-46]OZA37244.1 MAG: outer membrane lipoprotein LolB [Hydrogenophilales bacterium 17-64-34]HQS99009.1 lipoprotein insertase outer membrane protein LolB [Thiobacillus sp.]
MRASLFVWLPVLWLAGCATAPVPMVGEAEPATRWTLTGRLGIQTDSQSLSGNLDWRHRPQFDVIVLATPLGQGVARIERRPGEVVLDIPNQPQRRAADAETLMQDALGYSLPLTGLVWWIQARPDPRRPADVKREATGRVERIVQDGWTVDFLQYADKRPRKLALIRDGLELRLVLDSWQAE